MFKIAAGVGGKVEVALPCGSACSFSELLSSHALVNLRPSMPFSARNELTLVTSPVATFSPKTVQPLKPHSMNTTGEGRHGEDCKAQCIAQSTFLFGKEFLEFLSLIIHCLLLEVGSDLLNGEVSHIHLHQIKSSKDFSVRQTIKKSSPNSQVISQGTGLFISIK